MTSTSCGGHTRIQSSLNIAENQEKIIELGGTQLLRPNVEISMFPVFLPYRIFLEAHSYGNTFPNFFKCGTKENNTYLLTNVC